MSQFDSASSFFARSLSPALDLHGMSPTSKDIQIKESAVGVDGVTIDANLWLPSCAEEYNISPRLSDYVLVPVPAVVTDILNTNGEGIKLEQAIRFYPEMGMQMYKTFKGQPTHVEHKNEDYTIAKGVIFDSYLKPIPGFSMRHARLILLLGFDRTRDPQLANRILTNDLNTYSVGMKYPQYECSVCGNITHQDTMRLCSHTRMGRRTYIHESGKLAGRWMHRPKGFECSAVEKPAFVNCHHNGHQVMSL